MQDNLLSLKHQGCTCNRREILSVHSDLADRCTLVGQKVKPELKICISVALVSVTKEHASYGEITESKAGQGALLLNILQK
ncbi:dynamin-related protein 3A-like [Salvia splendens]|uniref:dynamin-related protein 3A-like n=1 Tax=Salvia splendens TaxID=180675 RepID=UPI001C25490B|nr:dynamin-related protein 3A-like [Salvia splendens]XP_042038578.1 dynamin-related protein 3A-like [Salvia splendens]